MVRFITRIAALCLIAIALAVVANAVSPYAIAWLPEPGQSSVTDETLIDKADISPEQVLERTDSGLAIVIDARPEGAFTAGHVPGAINIPGQALIDGDQDLADRLATYLPGPEMIDPMIIVIYCAGAKCTDSAMVFDYLSDEGYRPALRVMKAGWPGWQAAGLPVEEGGP